MKNKMTCQRPAEILEYFQVQSSISWNIRTKYLMLFKVSTALLICYRKNMNDCCFFLTGTFTDSTKGLCTFLEEEDKLIVSYGNSIGCRSTNRGRQIFLNTILQLAEIPKNGKITIELDIVKVCLSDWFCYLRFLLMHYSIYPLITVLCFILFIN